MVLPELRCIVWGERKQISGRGLEQDVQYYSTCFHDDGYHGYWSFCGTYQTVHWNQMKMKNDVSCMTWNHHICGDTERMVRELEIMYRTHFDKQALLPLSHELDTTWRGMYTTLYCECECVYVLVVAIRGT